MSAWLRSGRVIVAEVLGLGAGALIAAGVPQEPDGAAIRELATRNPRLAGVLDAFGFHHVVTGWWFLVLVALATLSLVAVQIDQWRRLRRTWRRPPSSAEIGRWPFRVVLPLAHARSVPPAPRIETTGRLGQLGSPIFHLGLLAVVTAGLLRLLFFGEGVAIVAEGATLGSTRAAFVATRSGLAGAPVATGRLMRVEQLTPEFYASGALKQITARIVPLGPGGGAPEEVAVNSPLALGGGLTLSIDPASGEAALLVLRGPGGEQPVQVELESVAGGRKGRIFLPDGRELRVRTRGGTAPEGAVDVRLVRGSSLLAFGALRAGEGLPVGPGEALEFVALRRWVTLRVERDPSRPLFFLGVGLAVVGVFLMFAFVRVDTAVLVEGEGLVVALRAQRFPALYAERFERLRRTWEMT